MDAVSPLDQMAPAEKLRATEVLRADLPRRDDTREPPAWHADILRKRDQRIAEGQEPSADWAEAKRRLRERLR